MDETDRPPNQPPGLGRRSFIAGGGAIVAAGLIGSSLLHPARASAAPAGYNQPFTAPVPGLTDRWGWRVIDGENRFHYALDYGIGAAGREIRSVAAGQVVSAGNSNGSPGWYVVVQHDGGIKSEYWHMTAHSVVVMPGQPVLAGEKLGIVGNTGESYGAHLHLVIWQGGTRIDPEAFLAGAPAAPEVPQQPEPPQEEEDDDMTLKIILDPLTQVQWLANSATGKRTQIFTAQQSTLVHRYLSKPNYAVGGTLAPPYPQLTLAELDIVLTLIGQTQ